MGSLTSDCWRAILQWLTAGDWLVVARVSRALSVVCAQDRLWRLCLFPRLVYAVPNSLVLAAGLDVALPDALQGDHACRICGSLFDDADSLGCHVAEMRHFDQIRHAVRRWMTDLMDEAQCWVVRCTADAILTKEPLGDGKQLHCLWKPDERNPTRCSAHSLVAALQQWELADLLTTSNLVDCDSRISGHASGGQVWYGHGSSSKGYKNVRPLLICAYEGAVLLCMEILLMRSDAPRRDLLCSIKKSEAYYEDEWEGHRDDGARCQFNPIPFYHLKNPVRKHLMAQLGIDQSRESLDKLLETPGELTCGKWGTDIRTGSDLRSSLLKEFCS